MDEELRALYIIARRCAQSRRKRLRGDCGVLTQLDGLVAHSLARTKGFNPFYRRFSDCRHGAIDGCASV